MRRAASGLARTAHGAATRAFCVTPALRNAAPRRARAFAAAATSSPSSDTSSSTDWHPAPLEPVTSAYVHLPFCRRRCYYCDFAISVVGDNVESDAVRFGMENYVDRLVCEIQRTRLAPSTAAAAGTTAESAKKYHPLRTVFFGGGTPSLVHPELLGKILRALREKFGMCFDAEVSMEMDPGTFDAEKLAWYLDMGVTRVSLGVQSFDAGVLQQAGRAHSVEDAHRACDLVREAVSARRNMRENINKKYSWSLDLISGLPGCGLDTWNASLLEAVAKSPDHVSVYDLQIEEGTPFGRWYTEGVEQKDSKNKSELPGENVTAQMLADASRVLRLENYEHYEVSSYARPGFRCQHNQVYWNSGKQGWYGFGMAATSHVDSNAPRLPRPRRMKQWEAFVDAMSLDVEIKGEVEGGDEKSREELRASLRAEALLERLMLGLRTRDGVSLDALAIEFGSRVVDEVLQVLSRQPKGLAVVADDGSETDVVDFLSKSATSSAIEKNAVVRLTDPEGILVSTEIIAGLVARCPSLQAL